MSASDTGGHGYDATGVAQLEAIWGDGFMSPGGPAEVGRIVAGAHIRGADVLDIGCGTGGAALVLAIEHGARTVTGLDVEPYVIGHAIQRATAAGESGRVHFQVTEPGPLPLPDSSVDVVFSKDAIIHVRDKHALCAEAFRVLRPGGRLCIGDWLRGEGAELDPDVNAFVESAGEDFHMQTLRELGETVSLAGFIDIELEDRCDWYHGEAVEELARLREPTGETPISKLGSELIEASIQFWEVLVTSTARGVLRPGHVRASKSRT